MDYYKLMATAMIITFSIPAIIYLGFFVAEIVKDKVKRRRYLRRFER